MATNPNKNGASKAYNPQEVEERLYTWWESSGFFKPRPNPNKQPFTIIMPPPNVTGELHLGHALTATVEDALVRYHRMLGEPTLWLPGSDHAGIATQMVVERSLLDEGTSRHELGRDQFVDRIWQWVSKYGHIIDNQLRRMGASCDWSRKAFTLDPGPSKAVRTTFKQLYDKGLIYRGERMINWCTSCQTALSDLEVEHEEEEGNLYHIRYPLSDGNEYLTVATTRPETLFGDTAVAVNPEDPRAASFAGRHVHLPLTDRQIPVISDSAVDATFGTGALKITPAHDPNDFEIGQRHGLPSRNVLNVDGTLNSEAGFFEGQDRIEARAAVVNQLQEAGLLDRIQPHTHSVGHCQRSGDVIEPILSTQWFVSVAPLAKRAIEVVENNEILIVPERFSKVYLNWMENIRDWCISRQLWWGHRIPVWYCEGQHETVEIDTPTECGICGSTFLQQDDDVLDTWFSSGLWTHSTLGWPDQNNDLGYFYPTSVMETGYDILFFWVARMIMLGIANMGDVPFKTVFLHGLVRDEHGIKMSKTRGNVTDPIEAIQTYGTDALRFALTMGTAPGNDTRVSEGRLQASRNFANKLWNAGRYVMTVLEGSDSKKDWIQPPPQEHREDQWIVGRLDNVCKEITTLWDEFQIGEAQRIAYEFIWNEFCDWYIELAKIRLRSGDPSPGHVLAHTFERSLRMLHPFMPFVTEELWLQLKRLLPANVALPESIMLAEYPRPVGQKDPSDAIEELLLISEIVRGIRNIRAEFRIEPNTKIDALILAPHHAHIISQESNAIRHMARVEKLDVTTFEPETKQPDAVTFMVKQVVVTLDVGTKVDMQEENRRIREELDHVQATIERISKLVDDPMFNGKAPPEVVERERKRLEDSIARQSVLAGLLENSAQ